MASVDGEEAGLFSVGHTGVGRREGAWGSKGGTSRSRPRERRQRWSKMVGVESEKKEGTGVRRRGLR